MSSEKMRDRAKEKIDFKSRDFITRWKDSNIDRIKEMYILDLKVL